MKYSLTLSAFFIITISLMLMMACGSDDEGLSEFELEHGIGPITEIVELGELDMAKAERGKQIFESQCVACHQLDSVVTGPRLRNVTDRRTPEFVLNYILNPREMSNKHPAGQQMSGEYRGVKADLGLSQDEALTVLEYLRAAQKGEL